MDDATKKKLIGRLKRAEGQIAAIRRMVEEERECVDVLTQISAAQGALSKAGQVLLGSHIETCVADTFRSGNSARRKQRIDELLDVFGRFGGASVK